MLKVIAVIFTVALLVYNDFELLGVLHGYIMDMLP